MSGVPTFICKNPDAPEAWPRDSWAGEMEWPEYVRRDPAVLAELPEVKAMIAAAVLEAAAEADSEGWPDAMSKQHYAALTERDEAEMDCGTRIADAIRARITPDAKAALEAYRDREVRKALEGAIALVPYESIRQEIRAMIPEEKPHE